MTPANIEVLVVTVMAMAEAAEANQLIGFDAGPTMADEAVLGVAKCAANVGDPLAVITMGVVEMVAAANLAAGDPVYSDANGQPTGVGATMPFGRVIKGGASGDVIAIHLKS